MGELFIDTDGEMTFENRERLNFVMHFVKKGAHYSTLETKDGVFVHEDTELSFNEIWLPCAQAKQSKIEQLEKELAQMKHINDEQNKNLANAFKTIEIQQKFDADSQGAIACLTEMNGRLEKRIAEATNHLNDVRSKGMDQSCYLALKALRGECG